MKDAFRSSPSRASPFSRSTPRSCDTARQTGHITPHLSVGQANGKAELARFLEEVELAFSPIEFEVQSVALIAREGETPFVVDKRIRLGAVV